MTIREDPVVRRLVTLLAIVDAQADSGALFRLRRALESALHLRIQYVAEDGHATEDRIVAAWIHLVKLSASGLVNDTRYVRALRRLSSIAIAHAVHLKPRTVHAMRVRLDELRALPSLVARLQRDQQSAHYRQPVARRWR